MYTNNWLAGCMGGGAYEAQRLVPPQILGAGGTLWSVPPQDFCG